MRGWGGWGLGEGLRVSASNRVARWRTTEPACSALGCVAKGGPLLLTRLHLTPPTRLSRPAAGVPMVAISWQEMQCPQTKAVENRKVAKLEQ